MYYGAASEATMYFSGIAPPCPAYYNPADYLLELAVSERDDSGELIKDRLIQYYEKQHVDRTQDVSPYAESGVTAESKWPASFMQQFMLLGSRAVRQKKGSVFRPLHLGQICCVTAIVSLIWFQRDDDVDTIEDRLGILFFSTVYWTLVPMLKVITTFPSERSVLARERATGSYRLSAFYLSKQCAEIPLDLLLASFYAIIVYWYFFFFLQNSCLPPYLFFFFHSLGQPI